jgi:PKD repeat protein
MQQLEQWKRFAEVVSVALFGVATLVASGGGGIGPDLFCGSNTDIETSCFRAVPPGPSAPPTAQSKRSPVVVISSAGARAAIMTTERENDDPQRPVQKFGRSFTFVPPTLGQPQALAGQTEQTFISSQKAAPGALATDASGTAIAVWVAGNAGVPEIYSSHYSAATGDWSPRVLIATPSGGVTGVSRVAMDGFGRALVAWSDGDGASHTRAFLPAQGWITPTTQIPGASDVAMRRNQGHALFNDPAGDLFIAQLDNYNWSARVRVGSGVNAAFGSPRLATHRDAPDGSLIAVWARSDGIYVNRLTANGPEFADGQKIPGSDNGREPQVVMGANEETTVVWSTINGTFANRAIGRMWGTAQLIDSGSNPRLAGDALGNAVLVYASSLENSTNTVSVTRFIRGSGWQPGEQIGTDLVRQGIADVAMDDNGRGLVVWEQEITSTPDPLDTRIATAIIGAPIARFSSSPDPALVGVTVVFDATASSDPGGSIARYDWDYTGDGVADAVNVSSIFNHVYTQAGTYRVKLVVTDNSGLVSEAFKDVVVGSSSLYGTNLLVNPAFELPVTVGFLPTAPGNWRGDLAVSVGVDRGITPRSAPNMLRFDAAGDVTSNNTVASQQWQIVDVNALAADIAAGRVRADASAWFNRVVGDLTTDRRFDIRLLAFNVAAADLPAAYVAGTQLAVQTASIQTIGNVWQQAALNMTLPAGTRLLLVEIYAFEDVVNDGNTPEFAGHYADDISLVLTRN